uniref:Uncharacterized protein n=1 Tax=Romanomermis culicivorax TaxID=13658 RepID=A0A915KIK7_ROMCU
MNVDHKSNENATVDEILMIRNESLNCAIWLKTPGHGLCYGTNKGRLIFVTGKENDTEKVESYLESEVVARAQRIVLMRILNNRLNLTRRLSDNENSDSTRTVIV